MELNLSEILGASRPEPRKDWSDSDPEAQRNELRLLRADLEASADGDRFKRWDEIEFIPNASSFKKEFLDTHVLIFWDYLDEIPEYWCKQLMSNAAEMDRKQAPVPDARFAYWDGKIGFCFELADSRFLRRKPAKTPAPDIGMASAL